MTKMLRASQLSDFGLRHSSFVICPSPFVIRHSSFVILPCVLMPEPLESQSPSPRLASVDALRGFDMFWIMGGDYIVRSWPRIHDSALTRGLAAQMDHCEWAGFHFYDLI